MERGFLVAGKQRPAGRRRRWAIQEKGAAEGDRIRKRGERRGGGGKLRAAAREAWLGGSEAVEGAAAGDGGSCGREESHGH